MQEENMNTRAIAFAMGLCVLFTTIQAASAQTRIRVGNFANVFVLPLFNAIEKGYFEEQNLEVEVISYQTGPAVVSAVAGGEIEIAWAAAIPPIIARSRGIPVKIFLTAAQEKQPDHTLLWVVSPEKAGIQSLKDLKNKTVMINANGGGCELALRDRLESAGLNWSDIKRVVVPFPQMQPALELGNADAACTIEPFYQSMIASDKIKPKVVIAGQFSDTSTEALANGFFALEAWLNSHRDAAIAFGRIYDKSKKELDADKERRLALAEKYLQLKPEIAGRIDLSSWSESSVATPKSVQSTINAMHRAGLIPELRADQVVETLPF
jgi:NitT/TauT family transport system substrate-binding protein